MGGDAVGTLNQFLKFSFAPVLAWRYDLCLRQVFLILQTEDLLCAVLRLLEGLVHLACWLHDSTNAQFARPTVAHCEAGAVNSVTAKDFHLRKLLFFSN